MQQPIATASLYFSEGGSDKVYHAQIIGDDASGYVVNFQYGRRGSTLQSGSKTPSPVPLVKAQAVFDKIVKEKVSKGYSPDASGTPFVGTSNAGRSSGVNLQLLNPITREEAHALIHDDFWAMQQKMDGERRAVKVDVDGNVIGINRKGLTVALPQSIADAALQCLPRDSVVDGEQVGDTLFVFDVLRYGGRDIANMTYHERSMGLLMGIPGAASRNDPLRCVPLHRTSLEKAAAFAEFEEARAEGVVFKRLDAPHTPGRPASGGSQRKFKFVETATVKVLGMNDGVRSARMGLYDADGNLVEVGSVTIPPNAKLPAAGDLIEVRYLYAYPGGSLYQPIYCAPRTDLDDGAAALTQLKYKAEAMAD